jgi:hypothetical protein
MSRLRGVKERQREIVTPEITRPETIKPERPMPTHRTARLKKGNHDPGKNGDRSYLQGKRKGEAPPRAPQKETRSRLQRNESLQKAVFFLKDNINKKGKELEEAVKGFQHPKVLFKVINHLIATSLGGWKDEGNCLVNESGRVASKKLWNLRNGRLLVRGAKKPPEINISWLLEARELTDARE